MKELNYQGLLSELKQGKVRPTYLFKGEEEFLIHKAIDGLKLQVLEKGLEEMRLQQFYPGEGRLSQFLVMLRSTPLGGGRWLGIVYNLKQLTPPEQERLIGYLRAPSPVAVLILQAEPDLPSPFLKELSQLTTVVEFLPLKGAELFAYLREMAREKGLRIESQALERLKELVGEDLAELSSELEKLHLFLGNSQRVTVDLVNSIVAGSRCYNPWRLSQAIGERNRAQALRVLRQLIDTNIPSSQLLGPVSRELFNLLILKGSTTSSQEELIGRLGCSPGLLYYLRRRAERWSQNELVSALKSLNRIDLGIKKGKGELEPLLELFILRFGRRSPARRG